MGSATADAYVSLAYMGPRIRTPPVSWRGFIFNILGASRKNLLLRRLYFVRKTKVVHQEHFSVHL
jgi:hypothetical protein